MADTQPVDSRKELLKVVGTLVGALVLFVAWSDWSQYNNIRTCPTRHLAMIEKALEQYRLDNGGALPTPGQETKLLGIYFRDEEVFSCFTGPKYLWPARPADSSRGHHLIVRCPHAAHGFIRTFSWGIDIDDGKLRIVRVKNSGKCVPLKLKRLATANGE